MLVPPCSTRAIPPAGERPVVVQCPYTLSSCPLFNPTFSTAEVLEAQAESKSTTTSDVDEASPAQSASSTKSPLPSYGLVESMRKAASPPASTGVETRRLVPVPVHRLFDRADRRWYSGRHACVGEQR